ncbi:MAG: T9SS type A sorting domain-containing protein [Candidatus Delongbacteria bacterium]
MTTALLTETRRRLWPLVLGLILVAAPAWSAGRTSTSADAERDLIQKEKDADRQADLARSRNPQFGEGSGERESGGPDPYGYVWLDNNEAAGPEFEWVDISTTGTQITPTTDDGFTGPYALGFSFPFYDQAYTDVFVASNGFLTFGVGAGSLSNQNLPTASTPNNLIALFWDDLDPGDGVGTIHYLADAANGRFIVQYTGVPDYPGPSSPPNTFQGILYDDGRIVIQYLDIQGDRTSATVGIENSTGTIGLTANYNNAGMTIENNKAVQFFISEDDITGPQITHVPLGNTDLAGGANSYVVNADLVDSQSGVGGATVYYQVNGGTFASVPMTAGTPPTWSAAIPGQAMGSTISYYILAMDVANPPNTSTSASWSFRVIDYTLAPTGLTASEGLLDIVNLTWTAPVWVAQAAAGPRPEFEDYLGQFTLKDEAWTAYQQDLAEWQAAGQPAGRAFLNYNVYRDGELVGTSTSLAYTDYPPEQEVFYEYYVTALFTAGESDPSNTDTGNMVGRPTEGGPDAMGYMWQNSNHPEGPGFEWVDISGTGTPVTALSDDGFTGPYDLGFNFPLYDAAYSQVYIACNGFLTFGTGNGSLSNQALPTTSTPNNLIALFWDDLDPGDGVGAIQYQSEPENGRFIVQYTGVPDYPGPNGLPNTFQGILHSDGRIEIQYLDIQGDRTSATVGIENSTGTIGLQVNYNNAGGLINNELAVAITPQEGDFVPPLIAHTPLQSVETELQGGYEVTATISDESGVSAARILYTVNGGAPVTVTMSNVTGEVWSGLIPHLDMGSSVAYHIEANDAGPNEALAVSATWSFSVVSYTWPPLSLAATDGSLLSTVITWLPPVNPGLLAARFGTPLPRSQDEFIDRLVQGEGLSKAQAYAVWDEFFGEAERAFIQYRVYRGAQQIGSTTALSLVDNLAAGADPDVTYTYTVRAEFTAGLSDPSNSDDGYWSLGQTEGGPDGFGYTWANSSAEGGPTFQWEDITATGTLLALTGDDAQTAINLSFPFPFYDATYTTASVVTNGYVNFGTVSTTYSNTTIPNVNQPNGCVFALWDDLYVPATGSVYFLDDTDNERAIIQWNNVTPLGSQTTPHTFQVILHADGTILVQYLDLAEAQILDVTMGIEDITGADGLLYNFDGTGAPLADQVAIRFTYPVGPLIAHTPLTDVETELPGAHVVSAQITSELGVASALVEYSLNGGAAQSVAMTHGAGDTWTGNIPHQPAGTTVAYHIEATDTENNERASMTWSFQLVSSQWPPINLSASDGLLSQTNISWQPPVNPGLMASWFGDRTPRDEDEAVQRLMDERGLAKEAARALWRGLFEESERQFIQYRLYRDGELLTQTTDLVFVDNVDTGSAADVTYTYTVTAEFTAGESQPSNAETGYWGSPPTFGGPDAFGYTWISSLNPAGPAYEWVDLGGQGTAVTLTDDSFSGPVSMGITFPFYGQPMSELFISSNGHLSFGTGSTSLGGHYLPGVQLPNNLIALFWDDLNPSTGGTVSYFADAANERFIVQYENVPDYGNATGLNTFQAILSSTGVIQVNYASLLGDIANATLGIENSDGTIGLTYNDNSDGGLIQNELTILYSPVPDCDPVDCAGTQEVEPNEGWNDNNASYNLIHCDETVCGTLLSSGADTDTDWYLYNHFGGNISVSLDVSDFNGRISLREQTVDGATVASSNVFGRCFSEAFTVTGLTGGAYYLVVEHVGDPDLTTPQTYSLALTCSGDPCSGHLPVECVGTPEVEPNDGWNATPPNSNYGQIALGQTICGAVWANAGQRDMDWYRFHLDVADTVTFTAQVDAFDAALFITDFDPAGSVLLEVNEAPACAPETITLPNLPAGDYFLAIGHSTFEGVSEPQNYSLVFGTPSQPEDPCDNYVDVGNFHDIVQMARPAPMMVHHDGTGCPGGISSPGRDEVTRLVLSQTTDLQVTLHGDGDADEVILLLGNCAQPHSSCGAAVNVNGAGPQGETLTMANVPAGDYFLVADFAGPGETHPYSMSIIDMESGLGEGREFTFAVEPNFPNPFNPSTTISWTQPSLAAATLTVHDMRGALVEELELGVRGAGRHQVTWDATRFGSGVYFCTLTAGGQSHTLKAVLIK